MLIAQISDPHLSTRDAQLYGGYQPDYTFSTILKKISALDPNPDFVWLTGDLVEHGTSEEYTNFRARVAELRLPAAAIPGNHDRRAPFAANLADTGIRIGALPFLHLVVDDHPVRMIGLDTVIEGEPGGTLCPERLTWLTDRLAESPDRPTMIFMHHPPFATGIGFSDATRCTNADKLAEIIARHPNVLRVSAGHVHRSVQGRLAGSIAGICPSVAWAVPLDLRPDAPLRLEPSHPGFQLHLWRPDTGLVTHTEFLYDG